MRKEVARYAIVVSLTAATAVVAAEVPTVSYPSGYRQWST